MRGLLARRGRDRRAAVGWGGKEGVGERDGGMVDVREVEGIKFREQREHTDRGGR